MKKVFKENRGYLQFGGPDDLIVPMMKSVDLADATQAVTDLILTDHPEGFILTRGRKPVAVVLPTGDADIENISVSYHPGFRAMMREADRELARGEGIPLQQVFMELNIPLKPKAASKNGP